MNDEQPEATTARPETESTASSNGSTSASGSPDPVDPRGPSAVTPDDLPWHTTYDRASVDRYLADVDAERTRLKARIAAAEARADEARARAERVKAASESQVAALVLATRAELDRIEEEHRTAVDAIRAGALEKAARILEAARAEAATVDGAAAAIARVRTSASSGGSPVEHHADADGSSGTDEPGREPEERIDAG